jgi:hypothetical protein
MYFKCQFQNLKFQKESNYIVAIPFDFWKSFAYGQGTLEPDLESAREHALFQRTCQCGSKLKFISFPSLNFIQIIYDWFIVANVTSLKFPTNTLKINTLMLLRVGVGKVGVCANSHFWEEWT